MLVVITTYGIEATRLLRAAGGAGARDRAAAIVFAYDAGLVTPAPEANARGGEVWNASGHAAPGAVAGRSSRAGPGNR